MTANKNRSNSTIEKQPSERNLLETFQSNTTAVSKAAKEIKKAIGSPLKPIRDEGSSLIDRGSYLQLPQQGGLHSEQSSESDVTKPKRKSTTTTTTQRKSSNASTTNRPTTPSKLNTTTSKLSLNEKSKKPTASSASLTASNKTAPSSLNLSTGGASNGSGKKILKTKSALSINSNNSSNTEKGTKKSLAANLNDSNTSTKHSTSGIATAVQVPDEVFKLLKKQLEEATEAARNNSIKLSISEKEVEASQQREIKLQDAVRELQRNLLKTQHDHETEMSKATDKVRENNKQWSKKVRELELDIYKEKLKYNNETRLLEEQISKWKAKAEMEEMKATAERENIVTELLEQTVRLECLDHERTLKEQEKEKIVNLYRLASQRINSTSNQLNELTGRAKKNIKICFLK